MKKQKLTRSLFNQQLEDQHFTKAEAHSLIAEIQLRSEKEASPGWQGSETTLDDTGIIARSTEGHVNVYITNDMFTEMVRRSLKSLMEGP